MGSNFHTPYQDGVTLLNDAYLNPPFSSLDRAITYQKSRIVSCDGQITYDKVTGVLAWAGTIRIHFNRSDGQATLNTIAAGNITLADNEFAYVDLNETDGTALTVAKAAITTAAASNFLAYGRVVLGYRNATADELFLVALVKGWTVDSEALPERNATVSLIPEYHGAVMTADGADNDPGTEGMTSDVAVSGNTSRNYYEWSSDIDTGLQDYDVFVQWQVPFDFVGFQVGTNQALLLEICTEENTTTNNKIDVTLQKNGSATTSSLTAQKSSVAATWEQIGFDETNAVLSALVAGDVLNIRVKLYSQYSKYARIGRIDFALRLQ